MAKSQKQNNYIKGPYFREAIFIGIALFSLYVIAPHLNQFSDGFKAVKHAQGQLVLLACLAVCGAVTFSAAAYNRLSFKPIPFRLDLLVQTSGMFVNRLLPAGIGGMGLRADFLYRRGHSAARAGAIVLLNNTLTSIGHFTLLLIAVVLGGLAWPSIHLPKVSTFTYVFIICVVVLVIVIVNARYARVFMRFLLEFFHSLGLYGSRKRSILAAYIFAMLNTTSHVTALYLCMLAFGLHLPVVVALAALTGGVAVASVTPTPGGLLGSEAGLTAVLIGYGIESGTALAVALSYRLVSYWLPLVPGAAAFWYVQNKKLV